MEEGERRGGERGVLGLGVGMGEEQTGDRVLARAGDWDRLATGRRGREIGREGELHWSP